MTIILFILILGVLIFVHELGHFVTAKFFGIRVDEFGMGLPPRAAKLFSRSGTDYTLNWIPFGGFVKIYGEDDKFRAKEDLQKLVDEINHKLEEIFTKKESDIMAV